MSIEHSLRSALFKFALLSACSAICVYGGRHAGNGGWRRRLLDNPNTDFCAKYDEWKTYYDSANHQIIFDVSDGECGLADDAESDACVNSNDHVDADCGSRDLTQEGCGDVETNPNSTGTCAKSGGGADANCDASGAQANQAACEGTNDLSYNPCAWTTSLVKECSFLAGATGCAQTTDAACEAATDDGGAAGNVKTCKWTSSLTSDIVAIGNEGDMLAQNLGEAQIQSSEDCTGINDLSTELKGWLQENEGNTETVGQDAYDRALHSYIVLENHYGCCIMRNGNSFQIMDLLSRINLLCSTYDQSTCHEDLDALGHLDCENIFQVCPAVTAPSGGGLDLDAVANYGAVVIASNENFQEETDLEEEIGRRRMQECSSGAESGTATVLLSWGTEYYGTQLGHIALVIGDVDLTGDDLVPDERWISFGPATNTANYQEPITRGDIYSLLQGMPAHISKYSEEYGMFDDYMTFHSLDTEAMIAKWNSIRERPGRYSMIDRNCMTVVAEILNAGMIEECGVATRRLTTPQSFFNSLAAELADQVVPRVAAASSTVGVPGVDPLQAKLERAFTSFKTEVPECQCVVQGDRSDTFLCERKNYMTESVAHVDDMTFMKRKATGRQCMRAQDRINAQTGESRLGCEYGQLCRNPEYQENQLQCGQRSERQCLNTKLSEKSCIWVTGPTNPGECRDYTVGDCTNLHNAVDCFTNKHVCRLGFYDETTDTTRCKEKVPAHCPSLGGFPKTESGETASRSCPRGFSGEMTRVCNGKTWGQKNTSECEKEERISVVPMVAGPVGRRLARAELGFEARQV